VGPRPNVERETRQYTTVERELLHVRPGVTDFSSVVFADLSEILEGADDANQAYKLLVRPTKSRLGLIYTRSRSNWLDLRLIAMTVAAFVSRPLALRGVNSLLAECGADAQILAIASRQQPLKPGTPPGSVVRIPPEQRGDSAGQTDERVTVEVG
jgi:hypothetical protein